MYIYQTKIKLHETDAAGLLFFSQQFKLMHDAYEALLNDIGFGFAELLRNKDFFLPIVHAEADFKAPLFVDDIIEIQVTLEAVGQTSFTFSYNIFKADQTLVGTGQTVHVSMNKETSQKIALPQVLVEKINHLAKKK